MGPLQTGNDLVSALMKEAINWIYCWDCYRDEHRGSLVRYMGCQLGVPRSRDHSFFYCGYQPLHVETAKWMVELRALPKEEKISGLLFGEGQHSVYCYHFPVHHQGHDPGPEGYEHRMPCKIGKSKGCAVSRVEDQMGTACFERPLIDWIYKTDNPDLVESYLHAHFKLRWQWINHAPGKEWFHCARRGDCSPKGHGEGPRKGLCGLRALTPLCWSGRRSGPGTS